MVCVSQVCKLTCAAVRSGSSFPSEASGDSFFALASEQVRGLRQPPDVLMRMQCARLGMGSTNSMTCTFEKYTVVYLNVAPLVVSVVGTAEMNVGLMHGLLPDIKSRLESVRASIKSAK